MENSLDDWIRQNCAEAPGFTSICANTVGSTTLNHPATHAIEDGSFFVRVHEPRPTTTLQIPKYGIPPGSDGQSPYMAYNATAFGLYPRGDFAARTPSTGSSFVITPLSPAAPLSAGPLVNSPQCSPSGHTTLSPHIERFNLNTSPLQKSPPFHLPDSLHPDAQTAEHHQASGLFLNVEQACPYLEGDLDLPLSVLRAPTPPISTSPTSFTPNRVTQYGQSSPTSQQPPQPIPQYQDTIQAPSSFTMDNDLLVGHSIIPTHSACNYPSDPTQAGIYGGDTGSMVNGVHQSESVDWLVEDQPFTEGCPSPTSFRHNYPHQPYGVQATPVAHPGTLEYEGLVLRKLGPTSSKIRDVADSKRIRPRNFECQICQDTFTSRQNLGNHMNSHAGVSPFKCHDCNKLYRHSRSLNRHRAQAHPEPQA